jgi:hypothetical protein
VTDPWLEVNPKVPAAGSATQCGLCEQRDIQAASQNRLFDDTPHAPRVTQGRYDPLHFASRRRCTSSRSPNDMTVKCLRAAEEIVNWTAYFASIKL